MVQLWLMVFLAACGAAHANTPRFDALVSRAREARSAGDLEGALAALREAQSLAPSPALANNIGVTLEELGRYAEARDVFGALAEDPTLPPERRDDVMRAYTALRDKADAAWLWVGAAPGARLWVADEALVPGVASRLPPGSHWVEATGLKGDTSAMFEVVLERGRETRLDLGTPESWLGGLEFTAPTRVDLDGHLARPELTGTRFFTTPGDRELAVHGERVRVRVVAGQVIHVAPVSRRPVLGPALVGGLGLAGVTVGAIVWGVAEDERSTLRTTLSDEPVIRLSRKDALVRERNLDTRASLGAGALGVGSTALVAALVWWLAGSDDTLTVTSQGLAVSW